MKRLNEEEWNIMKEALSIKQMEQVQLEGMITLNKKQMIERLIEDNEEINNVVLKEMKEENVQDEYKPMIKQIRQNALKHIEENIKLFTKLINSKDEYQASFMKGEKA